jgi:hypothetical protein
MLLNGTSLGSKCLFILLLLRERTVIDRTTGRAESGGEGKNEVALYNGLVAVALIKENVSKATCLAVGRREYVPVGLTAASLLPTPTDKHVALLTFFQCRPAC